MKKITILFLLLTSVCQAQIQLSDKAEISVLTLGPWQGEVYTAFGHSAFRVYDPVNGIDDAYNYGVFDYNKPNFYLNFARGYNAYQLGVMDYKMFEYTYIYFNRFIHEQVLNLSMDQQQKLFNFLHWNALPENREYYYDYFYDNCATKIPEVIVKVFGDSVKFDGTHITTNYTIRELTDLYLENQPWGDLGIDIGLGLPTDKVATPYEYMFLPDYVESGFAHATIMKGTVQQPLVRETKVVYSSVPEAYKSTLFNPLFIFSAFLIMTLYISYRDIRRNKLSMIFDGILFATLGLLGISLFLLWTATNHQAAAKNFNILWALPTHLIAVTAFYKQPKWLEKYFLLTTILTGILLLTWALIPQKLNHALIPLVCAIGLRSYTQYRIRKPVW